MRRAAEWIEKNDLFAIVGHVSPDGDSYGSCMALCLALRKAGKKAFVLAPELPHMYKFLPRADVIANSTCMPFVPEAVIHLDTASRDRIGMPVDSTLPSMLIDHHATNPGFDDIAFIDGEASSTGEIIMRLLAEMKITPDKDMAECLYTAISTDTGNFQFSNTTPAAMRYVGDLMECGLDISKVSAFLFRTRTLARTRLTGRVLDTMRLSHDGHVAVGCVTLAMMKEFGAVHADTESIVNFLNEIEGTEVSALLEEREGCVKISFRSSGRYPVSGIAKQLGGGGHAFAAGATVEGTPDTVIELVEKLLGEAVG